MSNSFALDISKFVKKAPACANKVIRRVCFDLYQHLVDGTPYDTGRARGGWAIGVNEETLAPKRYVEPGSKANTSLEGMFGEAKSVLAQVKGDCVVYLCNNVSYIIPLEYNGHSKQKPKGWVRITLRQFQDYVKKYSAEL